MLPEILADWMKNQWFEAVSLIIAIVALSYAARANHMSKSAAKAAENSQLASLRIEAKSRLAEAHRSALSLRSNCQQNRSAWEQYANKHLPSLAGRPTAELSDIDVLAKEGAALLHRIDQHLANIDELNAAQLERGCQEAEIAALDIERLIYRLNRPPTHFN